MSLQPTSERPLRVAVIGSGPAGFFAADSLLKNPDIPVEVDLYERLPVPYGLVRYGVSPDHLRIRNVTGMFDRTAALPGFAYFGNVEIGRDLSLAELRRHYDAAIFAHGLPSDRRLGIPGEDLDGVVSAAAFASWYNGHPDHIDTVYPLDGPTAVVVGVGNVGVDVARIISRTPDELAPTDIPAAVHAQLADSRVTTVIMLARRGPGQAAFSTKELRELGDMAGCDLIIDPAELELNAETEEELADASRATQRRNVELMRELAVRPPAGHPRRLVLRFYASPVRLEGDGPEGAPGRVSRVVIERTRLEGPAGAQQAVATGELETLPCDLLLRSIGNAGEPLPELPFDPRRTVLANVDGRVVEGPAILPGLYATGWAKRGPAGVIGATKIESANVVALLLSDLPGLTPAPAPTRDAVRATLAARGVRVVDFADWKRLDALEVARGKAAGKARENFVHVADMLAALD